MKTMSELDDTDSCKLFMENKETYYLTEDEFIAKHLPALFDRGIPIPLQGWHPHDGPVKEPPKEKVVTHYKDLAFKEVK